MISEASRQNGERIFEKMVPFWPHLGDFACHFGPSWAAKGCQNQIFRHQIQKNNEKYEQKGRPGAMAEQT